MLKHYSHKVGTNFWHIEFGTKYRYKMFSSFKHSNLIEAAIKNRCVYHGIKIHRLSVMPKHVHMLITLPHNITESKALQLIKGESAFLYFKHSPNSRLRLPQGHLWSARGCATTVDKYIQNQKLHHTTA